MRDPYLYEDIPVLKNKGGIKDAELLKKAEGDITQYSMSMVYGTRIEKFDIAALCEIHRIIFGDIYDFAGKFRTIQITKPEIVLGGDAVRYSSPCDIIKELNSVSKEIAKLKSVKDKKEILFRLIRITASIWQIHPFREGNTRAVISFSVLLAASIGLELDYEIFKKHAAYVRNSLVWCCQGIYSKFEYLEKIYYDAAGMLEAFDDLKHKAETKDYTVVNGYYVADYKEMPHEYDENAK